MSKKRETIIMGIITTIAVGVITSILYNKKKELSTTLAQGIVSFNEKKYEEALALLLQVESKDFETILKIVECYEKLGNLTSALIYLNKAIKSKRLSNLIQKRFTFHFSLEMNKEAFKDLFLISLIDKGKEHKEKAADFLKKMCTTLAKNHKITGFASSVNFSDFFETLFFLKDLQDPAVVFLNSGEYEKCLEFIKESENEFHKLLVGCFLLINGEFTQSLKHLESIITTDFSKYVKILILFIKSKKLTRKDLEMLKNNIETETDPTVLYYTSKIFENTDDYTSQFQALQKCIVVFPNSCVINSLIVWYIRQNNSTEAQRLIKSALKDYPNSINLVCISLEFYLIKKNVEEAISLMERAEKVFENDPRIYLFKFMINESLNNSKIEILLEGIKIDPKYFKLYIYLGNNCKSGEESAEAYRKALECARSYDEIFTAYQLLTVIESQNELYKENEDLFKV